tara:strand:- start:628 stop:954 length:327 start_codon:yes stop_codon:yes gene_type:complete
MNWQNMPSNWKLKCLVEALDAALKPTRYIQIVYSLLPQNIMHHHIPPPDRYHARLRGWLPRIQLPQSRQQLILYKDNGNLNSKKITSEGSLKEGIPFQDLLLKIKLLF